MKKKGTGAPARRKPKPNTNENAAKCDKSKSKSNRLFVCFVCLFVCFLPAAIVDRRGDEGKSVHLTAPPPRHAPNEKKQEANKVERNKKKHQKFLKSEAPLCVLCHFSLFFPSLSLSLSPGKKYFIEEVKKRNSCSLLFCGNPTWMFCHHPLPPPLLSFLYICGEKVGFKVECLSIQTSTMTH